MIIMVKIIIKNKEKKIIQKKIIKLKGIVC